MNRREALQASVAALVGAVLPTEEQPQSLYAIGDITIEKSRQDSSQDFLKYYRLYEDGKEICLLEFEKYGFKTRVRSFISSGRFYYSGVLRKQFQNLTEGDFFNQAKIVAKEYKKYRLQTAMCKKIRQLVKNGTEFEIKEL